MKRIFKIICLLSISSCNIIQAIQNGKTNINDRFFGANNTQSNSCATSSNNPNSLSLTSGLVEFFHFEENSGNRIGVNGGFQLNETGSIGSTLGVCGNALYTNDYDNSNYLTPSNASSYAFGTSTDFSISFWVKFESSGAGYQFLQGDDDGGSTDMYISSYHDGTDLSLEVWFSSIGLVFNLGSVFNDDSSWQHVVLVFDRDVESKFYLNGSLYNTNSSTTTGSNLIHTSTEMIGARIYTLTVTPIKGAIDEYGFWNRALNSSEVAQLYSLQYNF